MSKNTASTDNKSTMMAGINVSGYGDDVDKLISFNTSLPRPKLQKGDGNILVRVLTVSLAPGDCRVMSGKTSLVQGPPSMPYIPGGDLCGIVVDVHEDEQTFKVGDCVVAMFDTAGPRGALAEFKLVKTEKAAIKPQALSPVDACALPSSALTAMLLVEQHVRKGDRVLVLGASGGVGTHLVQMLKPKGVSFVAATTTQRSLVQGLGADRVLDYRTEKWWEVPAFKENPFDLAVDLWGTRDPWDKAVSSGAVKSGRNGGRYITMVGDSPVIWFQHWWHIFKLIKDMTLREWWTALFRSYPRWKYHVGLAPSKGNLARLLTMAEHGEVKAVIDSTHSFDAEGVKQAFKIQKGRHAHGKVVVVVSEK